MSGRQRGIVAVVLLLSALVGPALAEDPAAPPSAQNSTGPQPQNLASGPGAVIQPTRILVYYFYKKPRCATCRRIETVVEQALQENFTEDLAAGRLEWHPVDLDQPVNQHYEREYKLYTKAVIVSEVKEGIEVRWKNLDQIWTLSKARGAFIDYIAEEVRAYLTPSP
jgi:hypothetical protein